MHHGTCFVILHPQQKNIRDFRLTMTIFALWGLSPCSLIDPLGWRLRVHTKRRQHSPTLHSIYPSRSHFSEKCFLGMLSAYVVTSGGRRFRQIWPRAILFSETTSKLRYTSIVPKLWKVLRRR
jgi:hypothetical protein